MLFSLFVIHLCALAAPGPDFFYVSRTALSGKTVHVFESALGVTLGILIWATLTLFGMNLLFEHLPWTKWVIMTAGAGYLIKLSIDIYRSAKEPFNLASDTQSTLRHVLWKGLFTNLSNPKAVIYFTSVFSSIPGIGDSHSLLSQIIFLIFLESLAWFFIVGRLFALERIRVAYSQHKRWVDYASAAIFFIFGILIIADVFHLISVAS